MAVARPRIRLLCNRSNGGFSNNISVCRTLSGSAFGCAARTRLTRIVNCSAHRRASFCSICDRPCLICCIRSKQASALVSVTPARSVVVVTCRRAIHRALIHCGGYSRLRSSPSAQVELRPTVCAHASATISRSNCMDIPLRILRAQFGRFCVLRQVRNIYGWPVEFSSRDGLEITFPTILRTFRAPQKRESFALFRLSPTTKNSSLPRSIFKMLGGNAVCVHARFRKTSGGWY